MMAENRASGRRQMREDWAHISHDIQRSTNSVDVLIGHGKKKKKVQIDKIDPVWERLCNSGLS